MSSAERPLACGLVEMSVVTLGHGPPLVATVRRFPPPGRPPGAPPGHGWSWGRVWSTSDLTATAGHVVVTVRAGAAMVIV